MRVLITGIAGFLGSHIADALVDEGADVWGIDNETTGRQENAATTEWVFGDVNELRGYVAFGADTDVVVHCAASYADPDDLSGDLMTNALGTVEVVRFAQAVGARVIYLQTALAYGHRPAHIGLLPLDTPLNPDNSYAISKTAGESYIRHSGVDHVIFRLANMYGPRNISGPIPTFYKRIRDGERCLIAPTRRDYVYVDDFVPLVVRAVHGEGDGIYHVASGSDVAIADVFDEVMYAMQREPDEVDFEFTSALDGDAPSILLDPERTRADFGWKTHTPLRSGIKAAVAWYDEHGVTNTYTHLPISEAH